MWNAPLESVSFKNELPALAPPVLRLKTPFPVTTKMLPLVSAAGPPPLFQMAARPLLLSARLGHSDDIRTQKIPLPNRRRRFAVSVECINTVVLGRDVDDVLIRGAYEEISHVQRLRVDLSVYRACEELLECRGVHARRRECPLLRVEAAAERLAMVGHHAGIVRHPDGRSRTHAGVSFSSRDDH